LQSDEVLTSLGYDQMLLASGDMSMYVVMDKSELDTCTIGHNSGGKQWFPEIAASSSSASSYSTTQYCRDGVIEVPWISVGIHPDRIVYGEGAWCGRHWAGLITQGAASRTPWTLSV
jgi:hypothetical protein